MVVEDSLTVRRHLCDALATDANVEVVGEAADGKRAVELCEQLRPDVVTLDMMLPVMSGLAVTEHIMAYCPTPILIVSASTNRGELFHTYDALAAGAVDVLDKPLGGESDGQWERRFIETVKVVSRIRVITHPRARLRWLARASAPTVKPEHTAAASKYRLVAIGVSTGGPAALVKILQAVPSGYPLPMVCALHIGEPFAVSFAEWLDAQSVHRVAYAIDGHAIDAYAGALVLAPADRHLVVRGGRLRLTTDPMRHSCRPSVDTLFESIASEFGATAVACLLTGMGRDGARGLLAVRRAGGLTIAQDEASSVVYGMPREAVALGAAERVSSLDEIARTIAELGTVMREAGEP